MSPDFTPNLSGIRLRGFALSGQRRSRLDAEREARTALIVRAYEQRRAGDTMADAIARVAVGAKIAAAKRQPEARAAAAAKAKRFHSDPAWKQAWLASMRSDAVREKVSARRLTPERRAILEGQGGLAIGL